MQVPRLLEIPIRFLPVPVIAVLGRLSDDQGRQLGRPRLFHVRPGIDIRPGIAAHRPGQLFPDLLPAQHAPVVAQFVKHGLAGLAAVLLEVLQADFHAGERPRAAETGSHPPPLLLQKRIQVSHPHVTVMDLAQKRLHRLDRRDDLVELPFVDRLGSLQRVPQPLGGDPHLVVSLLVVRVFEAVLVRHQPLEPAEDVPADVGDDAGAPHAALPLAQLAEDLLRHVAHLAQHPAGLEAIGRLDNPGLKDLALVLQVHQDMRDSRATGRLFHGGECLAEELNLHVFVAGVAELLGNPPKLFLPSLALLARDPTAQQLQGRAQPPRRNPGAVNILDVFRLANAVKLIGKLLGLFAEITGCQKPVAVVDEGLHDGLLIQSSRGRWMCREGRECRRRAVHSIALKPYVPWVAETSFPGRFPSVCGFMPHFSAKSLAPHSAPSCHDPARQNR